MKCHRSDDSQNKKQASEASDKSKYRMERKITVADIWCNQSLEHSSSNQMSVLKKLVKSSLLFMWTWLNTLLVLDK